MAIHSRLNLTSGNLVADKRSEYAEMLADSGDFVAASELQEQALQLAPRWAAGWFLLGQYREKAADLEGAETAYRHVLDLETDDIFGASLKLASLGRMALPATPPSSYVEGLFNDYADRFEASLVGKLGYSVPEKLAALIDENTGNSFRCTVDLGCGTGLFGQAIRERTERLEGFDLSEKMLAKAAFKKIYDRLERADLSLAPERSGLFGDASFHRSDLVAAADVMMYLGDLHAALSNAAALLCSGGILAFSVEKADLAEGFQLRQSLRYAHSERHVRKVLSSRGLDVNAMIETVIRLDQGEPVTGLLFLARKI